MFSPTETYGKWAASESCVTILNVFFGHFLFEKKVSRSHFGFSDIAILNWVELGGGA
jgi:hypothetical protein